MAPSLFAAALGGAAYALAHLGFGVWPLLFVFLLPLWWALDAGPRAGALGRAAAIGFVFGVVAHALGFAWLWRLVSVFLAGNRLVGAGWMLLHGAWFAGGFALYAGCYASLRDRGAGVALAGVPALVALEWLQPQLFPVQAGAGLVQAPLLAQCADLGGPLLLTALLALWNAALYRVIVPRERAADGAASLVAAALATLLLAAGYGAWRVHVFSVPPADATPLRVGIVQAGLAALALDRDAVATHRLHVAESEALLAEGPLDLVVWPETAYALGVRRPLPVDAGAIRGDVLSRARIPLLFGTSSFWQEAGRRVVANSVLLAGPDGRVEQAYDKNLLIPLAELAPEGAASLLASLLPHAQRYRAASATPALVLGGVRIATPICYEVIHASFVARMVREARPNLLITVANDGWFGDSAEPWAHLALTRLRAIEQRLPVVRATNSGISAFIDPTGRVAARTGVLERARLRGVVLPRSERMTLYARWGDWPGVAALGALALAFVDRRDGELNARRSRSPSGAPGAAAGRRE